MMKRSLNCIESKDTGKCGGDTRLMKGGTEVLYNALVAQDEVVKSR